MKKNLVVLGILPSYVGIIVNHEMGVSKNNGTPKWLVKIMENPIKMADLGVPLCFGNTQIRIPMNHLQLECFPIILKVSLLYGSTTTGATAVAGNDNVERRFANASTRDRILHWELTLVHTC